MSRTRDQVLQQVLALLPSPEWLWPRDPDSVLAKSLLPFAAEMALVEAAAEALLEEADPRVASALLPDYERVLGPDPAGRDLTALAIEARRRLVHQRWTARGGQSKAFFIAVAASLGVLITIDEARWTRCGSLRTGQRLGSRHPNQYIWRVNLPAASVRRLRTGSGRTGQRLGSFSRNQVEGIIRLWCPAHTLVVFAYTSAGSTAPLDAFVLDWNVLA